MTKTKRIAAYCVLDDRDTYSGLSGAHAIVINNKNRMNADQACDLDNGPDSAFFNSVINNDVKGVLVYDIEAMIDVTEVARALVLVLGYESNLSGKSKRAYNKLRRLMKIKKPTGGESMWISP